MKKYFKILITFFLLILLYITIDIGFNFNQQKQLFNDKNRISLNINMNKKNLSKFLNYIDNFSKKNDVIITKRIMLSKNLYIYSSDTNIKIANNPFIWSNNNQVDTFNISQIKNIGYNGFYNFSKNDVQEKFCQGIKQQKLGNCTIDLIHKESILSFVSVNYIVIMLNMTIILFTVYTYILLLKKREVNIRKLSGEYFKNIYFKMFDQKLLRYSFINLIIMVILLFINSLLTNNTQAYFNILLYYGIIIVIIFILILLYRLLIFYVFYKNAQYVNVQENYSKKEYNIFSAIFNILKLLLMIVIIFVISKQFVMLQDIKKSEKDLVIFSNHKNLYTFGVRYTGQLDSQNAAVYDKKASEFYKDLSRNGKLFMIDASRSLANKDYLSECSSTYNYSCNGAIVNENYLEKFTNLKIHNHNALNIFVHKKNKVNPKDIIKDVRDNMDLDGMRRKYIINYYNEDIELLTIDQNAYKINNPVILVDNFTYANDMYGSSLTGGNSIFFETNIKQPFTYLKNDIQKHNLQNEILEVYTPTSEITEEIVRLNQEYKQSLVIVTLSIVGLAALIYNNLRLYFDRYKNEMFLNIIHGVPLRYLIKRIYLINIVISVIIIILAMFLNLNIIVTMGVIIFELVLTYLLAWLLKNKIVKGEIK